jgi:hypothetical protein
MMSIAVPDAGEMKGAEYTLFVLFLLFLLRFLFVQHLDYVGFAIAGCLRKVSAISVRKAVSATIQPPVPGRGC